MRSGHFKQINDNYGHLTGDLVLHQAAQRLKAAVRHYDYVGRYGGEEFLIILADCSPAQTLEIAECTRAAMCSTAVSYQGLQIPVSVSMGVVIQTPNGLRPAEDLLLNADHCLLTAKLGGRNRVVHMRN